MTFEQRVSDLKQCNLSTQEAEAQARQEGYVPHEPPDDSDHGLPEFNHNLIR